MRRALVVVLHGSTILTPPPDGRILEFLSRDESVALSHAVDQMRGGPRAVRLPGGQLLGRGRGREVLERLRAAAGAGHGGVMTIHGEPGVGKTALVEDIVAAAGEFRVARALGVEGGMELAFAALQQLCAPLLDLTAL